MQFTYSRSSEVNGQIEITSIDVSKGKVTAQIVKEGQNYRRSFNIDITDSRVLFLDPPWGLDYERKVGVTHSFDAIDPDRLELIHCTTRIVEKRKAPDGSVRYVLELTQENDNEYEKEKGLPIKILLDENWDVHEIASGSLRIVRGTRDDVLNALPSEPPVIDNSIPVHGASVNWPQENNTVTIRFAVSDAGESPLLADSAYQKVFREGKTWTVALRRVTQVPGDNPPPAASRLPALMIEADDPDIQAKANEIALALALSGRIEKIENGVADGMAKPQRVGLRTQAKSDAKHRQWGAGGQRPLRNAEINNEYDRRALMLRLARWVAGHVSKPGGPPLASARAALRSGQGDCTEHAYLLCALARARGIPARAAFGLVYKDGRFIFHAWTEARIRDRWLPYDTTRGRYGALPARYILLDYDYGQSSDPAVLGLVAQMMEVRRIDVVPQPNEQ